jgi:hypothetical protein
MARKKNLERRSVILSNAYRLFYKYGYDNVTLKEIAKESNISTSLLQHYYGKKENISVELFYDYSYSLYRYINKKVSPLPHMLVIDGIWYCTFIKVITLNSSFINVCGTWIERTPIMVRSAEYTMTEPAVTSLKTNDEKIGVHVVDGTMSHLLVLYLNNIIPMNIKTLTDTCLTVYYRYHNYSDSKIQSIIEEIEGIATMDFANDFLEEYNKKMGYDERY